MRKEFTYILQKQKFNENGLNNQVTNDGLASSRKRSLNDLNT